MYRSQEFLDQVLPWGSGLASRINIEKEKDTVMHRLGRFRFRIE